MRKLKYFAIWSCGISNVFDVKQYHDVHNKFINNNNFICWSQKWQYCTTFEHRVFLLVCICNEFIKNWGKTVRWLHVVHISFRSWHLTLELWAHDQQKNKQKIGFGSSKWQFHNFFSCSFLIRCCSFFFRMNDLINLINVLGFKCLYFES